MINKERVDEGRREFLKYLCKGTAVVTLAVAGMPLGGCGYSRASIGGSVDVNKYQHVPLHELALDLYRDGNFAKYEDRQIRTTGYLLGFDIARLKLEFDMTKTGCVSPPASGQGQIPPNLSSWRTQPQTGLSPAEKSLVIAQMPSYVAKYGGLAGERMSAEIQAGKVIGEAAGVFLFEKIPNLISTELGKAPACAVIGYGPLKLPMMFGAPLKESASRELSKKLGEMLYREVRVTGTVDGDDGFIMENITPVPGCFKPGDIPAQLELPVIKIPDGYTQIDLNEVKFLADLKGRRRLIFFAPPVSVKTEGSDSDGRHYDDLEALFSIPYNNTENSDRRIEVFETVESRHHAENTNKIAALLRAYAVNGELVGIPAESILFARAYGVETVCFREGNIKLE